MTLDNTPWIARAVPAGQRIARAIRRDGVEWAAPGQTLTQTFRSDGPIMSVNADIAGVRDVEDPYLADVRFTVALESIERDPIAQLVVDGPQLLWERFGRLIEVSPAAPAGEYRVVLRPERGVIGWHLQHEQNDVSDDGISPVRVEGTALRDDEPIDGTLLVGVDTTPAANPVFRRRIQLPSPVRDAKLSAAVLGSGYVRINGVRVGEEMLEPAVTAYDRTVLYRTWPVGHLLREGENEIVIEAGRERYAARGGDIWGWNLTPWHREPVASARLDVIHTDGTTSTITTGHGWMTAPGPVERELLFGGEDWAIGGPEPSWEAATVVAAPPGMLREAVHPPVRAGAPIPPVVTETLDSGAVVHDFGRVMTGRVRCVLTGRAGASVRVLSGEVRDTAGAVVCDNTLAAGDAQLDTVRLGGDVQDVVWEPQFSYRGFRWMQVETEGDVEVTMLRAVPLYAALEVVGDFDSDDPLITWIDSALAGTFRNNMHGVPTDTPIYEKHGWTADAHLATEALLHHFDLRTSFGKWMQDHADAQGADGSIPHIVPTPGWGAHSDPAWSTSAVLIPWYLYREYGDLGILERSSDMIRRYADHLLSRLDTGIWPDRTWGDWLAPGGYGVGPEGMAPIGTIMSVTALTHTSRILRELGIPDAAHYQREAERVGAAYHGAYFDAPTGSYRIGGIGYRQSLNVLPLAFDVVPPAAVDSVRRCLVDDIEHRTEGHLDTGAVATRHLLPVLSAAGRDDLALTVLTQRTRPGWGAWYREGENTLVEAWDVSARSRNHYFLGSVASWIQQRVGGLRLTEPGWAGFDVAPVDDERVQRARIAHRTPRGEAAVAWRRGPGGWDIDVTVPAASSAVVSIGEEPVRLDPGRHRVRLSVDEVSLRQRRRAREGRDS